jgi:hypothetical protein
MLPDRKLGARNRTASAWNLAKDRRPATARVAVTGELLVAWSHAAESPIRYVVLDMSEGGARIASTLPLREGMTGTVLSLLPSGTPIQRKFQLMWCRPGTGPASGYEAGLRFES